MWCIFKPFSTQQMAKTAKSKGRQYGFISQCQLVRLGNQPAFQTLPREISPYLPPN